MPSIIETLTLENQTLVTVTEKDSAKHALSLMIEHDFSQLPVVDSHQTLKGIITSDSILRAVSYFKVIPEKLKVSHAIIVKAKIHRDEEDLSELLKGLRDTSAIPMWTVVTKSSPSSPTTTLPNTSDTAPPISCSLKTLS